MKGQQIKVFWGIDKDDGSPIVNPSITGSEKEYAGDGMIHDAKSIEVVIAWRTDRLTWDE